tara:strand:+ start:1468 stop:1995 length:528 start_codon:yes stop_codon:yes gene_type:complete
MDKDRQSFSYFFDEYYPRVYRYCRSRVRQESWEDIAQEAMFKAIQGLASYRGDASLYTWLCQICRNEIVDWHRKNARHVGIDLDFDEQERKILEGIRQQDGLDMLEEIHTKRIIHLILDALPSNYGTILEMKYLKGMPVSEIAHALGTGEIAVQSLLARARSAFKKGYQELASEI